MNSQERTPGGGLKKHERSTTTGDRYSGELNQSHRVFVLSVERA